MSAKRSSEAFPRPASQFDPNVVDNGDPRGAEQPPVPDRPALRYLDVVAPLVIAPIVLALGAPAVGYGLGFATWLLVRTLGVAADRMAGSITNVAEQVSLRLAYRFARVSLLLAVTALAFKGDGRPDGLTALLVITFAFTIQLSLAIIYRPQFRR